MDRFPPPKRFTNALLGSHEITTLIRDTEPHERALFSIEPNTVNDITSNTRRNTAFTNGSDTNSYGRKSLHPNTLSIRQSAVARVLGNDLLQQIRQSSTDATRSKSGVNIEVLLRGAEKLCAVYSVSGATERVTALRNRHRQVTTSLSVYEELVAKQQVHLNRFNDSQKTEHREDRGSELAQGHSFEQQSLTERDFQLEEEEVSELEARKKYLESRVAGLEKDLGGLLK